MIVIIDHGCDKIIYLVSNALTKNMLRTPFSLAFARLIFVKRVKKLFKHIFARNLYLYSVFALVRFY